MHADRFSVGVELGKMTPCEAEWRALIARAHQPYAGPLVYSATQGPEFETIRFWEARLHRPNCGTSQSASAIWSGVPFTVKVVAAAETG
jgi:hypothetical protein